MPHMHKTGNHEHNERNGRYKRCKYDLTKNTISEMQNTLNEDYGRFHIGNKNTSEIECTVTGKIQNKAW